MNMITPVNANDADNQAEAQSAPRRGLRRRLSWVVLPIAAAGATYVMVNRSTPAPAAPALPTVTVAAPLQRDVTEWDDYVGRFQPSRTVEVRPRVSGQITALHFTDGQIVKQGQPLFTIDQRPYAAALAEARAGVATAKSDLALAHSDLDRARRLIDSEAVSKSEVDRLSARVQAATAALAAAEARVQQRALDMEFTVVRAPIGGKVSDRRVDAGNLVAAGEGPGGTLLTTINALDPIYFSFNGSEGLFLKAKRAQEAGVAASPVEIKLQDESDYRWKGRLDFTDNGLDPRSGTIRGRATISNPDLFLTPGMFGSMRLATGGTARALLVPDAAIVTDQARKTVLTVGRDGTVSARQVELGPVIDGLRVVRSGLAAGDKVVIDGIQMARPGAKVQRKDGRITPVAVADVPPAETQLIGQGTFAR